VDPPPPKLPPSRPLALPGRGTTWVYDSGPPADSDDDGALFLLHGWTSTAALNWYKCLPSLASRYRVVAMDHRGHGRGIRSRQPFRLEDCADDVAAVIEELELGPVTAVGYSMGGPIAQLLWRRHRDSVSGLVLCATSTRFARTQQYGNAIGTIGMGASMALSFVPARVRKRGMSLATRNWSQNNAAAAWAVEEWARHDPAALIQAGLALSRFDSSSWISEIDVPTAVVVTALDQTVAPRHQWAMSRSIRGAVAFPVQGDHRVCVDDPKHFIPALQSACKAARRLSAPTA
jgi:3-oxoadipate enol-lactonase